MKPSLITLFMRSRYFALPEWSEGESQEIQRERVEAERFAAAAIGFCMTHHPKFRRAFLREVCGFGGIKGPSGTVEVEPDHWADLLIRRGQREVCVVEIKINAKLLDKQNPAKDEFWSAPEGYGIRFAEAYPQSKKRYVILGPREWRGIPEKRDGWHFQTADWNDVLKAIKSLDKCGPLIEDLLHCFQTFNIREFSSSMTKDPHYFPSNAIGASYVSQLLWDTVSDPHLKLSTGVAAVRWSSFWRARDKWKFGIELWPQAHRALGRLLRPKSMLPMAWLGYESARGQEKAKRYLWFYCDEPEAAKLIVSRIKPEKHSEDKLLFKPSDPKKIGIELHTCYGYGDQAKFGGVLYRVLNFANDYQNWLESQEGVKAQRHRRRRNRPRISLRE